VIELCYIELNTKGKDEIINISDELRNILSKSNITNGNILVFVPGSTGAISTIEYEPGLIKDVPELMEKIIPENRHYHHNDTWHDGNGYSHLRATLIGPSLIIPFEERMLILGTWQQVVFLEFDNKPHHRRIAVQIMGE
jgi:secondary thiamine-phosphate synthase enzyme